jgi:hypothetical protein
MRMILVNFPSGRCSFQVYLREFILDNVMSCKVFSESSLSEDHSKRPKALKASSEKRI